MSEPGQPRTRQAHRVSYETFIGPIPDGLTIDHLCMRKACINPYHLEPVTELENKRRVPLEVWQRRPQSRPGGALHELACQGPNSEAGCTCTEVILGYV